MAELDTAGKLAQFVLRNGGHDGKPKFRVLVQGFDVVILEEYRNTNIQQVTGVLDGIQCVADETGYFFGEDQVEFAGFGIVNYPMEIFTFLCGYAGETFINIAGDIGPRCIFADEFFIVGNLVRQGVQLLLTVCGNTGIKGEPRIGIS